MNKNIKAENDKQRVKMKKLKEKYDRDGVNYIEDETEIGRTKSLVSDTLPDHLKYNPNLRRKESNG